MGGCVVIRGEMGTSDGPGFYSIAASQKLCYYYSLQLHMQYMVDVEASHFPLRNVLCGAVSFETFYNNSAAPCSYSCRGE